MDGMGLQQLDIAPITSSIPPFAQGLASIGFAMIL
jgi:hypothetical protein